MNTDEFFEKYGNHLNLERESDMFDDDFDRRFARHEKMMDRHFDNLTERPGRTFVKFGLVALLLNLLFWGAIIAMVVLGLNWLL